MRCSSNNEMVPICDGCWVWDGTVLTVILLLLLLLLACLLMLSWMVFKSRAALCSLSLRITRMVHGGGKYRLTGID